MNISDRMQGILQKLKGNVSDEERRALMREKFEVMSTPQETSDDMFQYRADGGIIGPTSEVKGGNQDYIVSDMEEVFAIVDELGGELPDHDMYEEIRPLLGQITYSTLKLLLQDMMRSREPVYRSEGGGYEEDGGPGLPDFVQQKIQQALGMGVDQSDISSTLKNNALKSRNARVRGALLKGGLTSYGKSSANQAGLITQAGLNNSSFTPGSTLGGVAQGFSEAGAANAKYHDELTRIDEKQQRHALSKEKEGRKGRGVEVEMLRVLREANPHLVNNNEEDGNGGE